MVLAGLLLAVTPGLPRVELAPELVLLLVCDCDKLGAIARRPDDPGVHHARKAQILNVCRAAGHFGGTGLPWAKISRSVFILCMELSGRFSISTGIPRTPNTFFSFLVCD
jgi:hypothetical protein